MSFLSTPISLFATKSRKIADLALQVVLSETTNDTLTITRQPVQQGASITDHAYKEPTTLSMAINLKDNIGESLSEIYTDLLELQESREPITVSTPKRIYSSMLISSIGLTTDARTENVLAINISFAQIIIVPVSTAQVPRSKQRNPGATAKTEKAGKKSALLSLKEGIGALVP
jgi:hypothetical protein